MKQEHVGTWSHAVLELEGTAETIWDTPHLTQGKRRHKERKTFAHVNHSVAELGTMFPTPNPARFTAPCWSPGREPGKVCMRDLVPLLIHSTLCLVHSQAGTPIIG